MDITGPTYDRLLTFFFSVGDDFEEVEEDENLDDLQEGEVSSNEGKGWAKQQGNGGGVWCFAVITSSQIVSTHSILGHTH